MRKILFLSALALLVLAFSACSGDATPDNRGSQKKDEVANVNRNIVTADNSDQVTQLEFPHVKGGTSRVISHFLSNGELNYSLEWDVDMRANRWSCYKLYASNLEHHTVRYRIDYDNDRANYFRLQYPTDPQMPAPYGWEAGRETDPYWGSGYAHGHVCPSADRLNSEEANYQTFYLTNMTPMEGTFNSGIWADVESQVRQWITLAIKNDAHYNFTADTLYVCKGGTIDKPDQRERRLTQGMTIPKYYYCALLMHNRYGYKAIGILLGHNPQGKITGLGGYPPYYYNIHDLEQFTGLDFFCNLPDDVEKSVENLPLDQVLRAWGIRQ